MNLYHYTDQNGFMGIFNDRALWATKIHYLNDKSEYYLATKIALKIINDRINVISEELKNKQMFEEYEININILFAYQEFSHRIEMVSNINLCVCSLTEQGDLLSQWRGYSKKIGGYSIGFDFQGIKSIANDNGFELVKCIYDELTQQERVESIINKSIELVGKSVERDQVKKRADYFEKELIKLAPALKDKSFSEEAEWRLISIVKTKDLDFRAGNSMIIPYKKIPLGQKIELRNILKEVIVGHTPHIVLAQRATQLFLIKTLIESGDLSSRYRPFDVLESAIPYRSW